MKVRIKKDVKNNYLLDQDSYLDDYEFEDILDNIAGKTLEVDTEFMFPNEFNLKPIPGLTNDFIRVFIEDVDKVIDDIRSGKAHCELCGETSDSLEVCTHCGHSDYLEPLIPEEQY
ncbi:hypothetical protein [Staphylococcus equorum]|uniref:Uncharacterized protein n=1 Tax=Staphylococcus equorum TaxID=246432 RepID=A0A9X4LGI5_9STAP|nr:hypothetical protein [Staphylococcus equorum]MDG0860350.1 hypothetical protein [Staphylococcus equorum]